MTIKRRILIKMHLEQQRRNVYGNAHNIKSVDNLCAQCTMTRCWVEDIKRAILSPLQFLQKRKLTFLGEMETV